MTKLHECRYRIGTTGTLDGMEVHKLVLEGLFAKCNQITTTAQLVREKYLSNLHIRCLVLRHIKEHCKGRTYPEEMAYLALSEARNKFISKLALSLDGNTLLLVQYIKQLEKLYNR